jgi:integrase
VRELLSRTRRGHAKRGALPRRKAALTREPLQALVDTCDDSLRGLRDRALLLFAWSSGGRRRAEVAAATRENVRQVAERLWIYTLDHAKGNQSGVDRAENDKPIAGAAADALAAWLAASRIQTGALFRRIRKGGCLGEPLSAAAVRRIVRERCRLAGLDGDFSAHSLRSGFVTEAGRQNVPLGDTMAMTGHASVATVMRYFRAGSVSNSKAAHLLDDDPSGRQRPS